MIMLFEVDKEVADLQKRQMAAKKKWQSLRVPVQKNEKDVKCATSVGVQNREVSISHSQERQEQY
jgi:hypothetical protein